MPPKIVTCSICSASVLKAQTLARTDGTRACRSHDGVAAEAEARQAAERTQRAMHDLDVVNAKARAHWQSHYARLNLHWEQEAAEFREYIYSHCWACGEYGYEWREFWTQAIVASKRLQLRGEFSFMSYGEDVKKLMGNVPLLAPITWKDEVTDRAVVKHLYKKVREIVHVIGFMLLCPPCCTRHGFKQRLEDMMPKPTWEQLEAMGAAVMAIDPLVTELAEKKERQS